MSIEFCEDCTRFYDTDYEEECPHCDQTLATLISSAMRELEGSVGDAAGRSAKEGVCSYDLPWRALEQPNQVGMQMGCNPWVR